MNKKEMKNIITSIAEVVKRFSWDIKDVYIKEYCIYAVVKNEYTVKEEGLFAGSQELREDVENIYYELKEIFVTN